MSRRDYEAIAGILRMAKLAEPDRQHTIGSIAADLADYMVSTNPQFDRERFMDATRPVPEQSWPMTRYDPPAREDAATQRWIKTGQRPASWPGKDRS